MKSRPILVTAAALALSAWPLRAQDNAPERPKDPPQREDGPRRPDAPQQRDARPHDGQFRREDRGNQGAQPDRAHDQRREDRPAHADGPQAQQGRPDGDSHREGQADRRGDRQGRGLPPRMEQRDRPNFSGPGDSRMAQRPDGMRRHPRRMMDNFGSAPRREGPQDFRRGGNEMRAPMPPPQQGPQFDRGGPDRAPFPPREQMNQRAPQDGPRPGFVPPHRGDRGFAPGPRREFDGPPPQDFRGPQSQRQHREGPPRPHWE